MRNYFVLIFLFSIFSCSTVKKTIDSKLYTDFKIIETQILAENDTIFINELRFYKIQSALDGMKLMYQNYGEWSQKTKGKYQSNINKIIWSNLKLLDNDKTFTVIAEGTETRTNYFACLLVFDSNGSDCLNMHHPLREKLTDLFVSKMNSLDKKTSVYKLFK